MEIVKGIFGFGILLLIIYWIFGGVVLLSVIGIGSVGFYILAYTREQEAEKARAEFRAFEEAEAKAREEKLAAMKPHERKNFLKQEEENERKRLEHNARAMAEIEKDREIRRQRNLAQRELELRERELAVREKAVAEAEKGKKVPLAVKTATSAAVGYKIGKTIGKW